MSPGQLKKFEDEEVKALFDQDSSQEELAELLNVDRSTIFKRLKVILE